MPICSFQDPGVGERLLVHSKQLYTSTVVPNHSEGYYWAVDGKIDPFAFLDHGRV